MSHFIVLIIKIYQKYISPYKGYRCAHASLYHGTSCSEEIISIIHSKGIIQGYDKIKLRFAECRHAYFSLSSKKKKTKDRKTSHWLDCCNCDCGSSACEISGCMTKSKHCDLPDLPCDCSIF